MSLTWILIGINVVLSFYAFNKPDVTRALIMNPYVVNTRGQYYRFITSGFIHKDHVHLLFNMIALYFFGQVVEIIFKAIFGSLGGAYYLLLYVLALVVSDIPSYFKHRGNPGYNSLGASGAVSAVVFAFILFRPIDKIYIYGILGINGFILGAVYLIYSYYQGRKGGDLVNHDAHLYGALFGLLFCIVMYPASIEIFIEQLREFRIFD